MHVLQLSSFGSFIKFPVLGNKRLQIKFVSLNEVMTQRAACTGLCGTISLDTHNIFI